MDDDTKTNETNVNLSPYPYEKAAAIAIEKTLDATEKFLSKLMSPALEEAGGILKDQMAYWRQARALKLIEKMRKKLMEQGHEDYYAPPRLIQTGIDHGSLVDPGELQEMWAGLLASSCTEDGTDDSNVIFMSILDQLTRPQAKILRYACETAEKKRSAHGLIYAEYLEVSLGDLVRISEINDIQRLDRELDRLRSLELIGGGFPLQIGTPEETVAAPESADISPSGLSLQLYVRCEGSQESPLKFFGI